MAGTKEGGRKAAQTNKLKYGLNFYADIGRKGGRNGHTGGFASMPAWKVQEAGRKGGKISKRGKAKKHIQVSQIEEQAMDVQIKRLQATN